MTTTIETKTSANGGAAISSMIPHLAHDGLCERCQRTKDAWYEALDFPAEGYVPKHDELLGEPSHAH